MINLKSLLKEWGQVQGPNGTRIKSGDLFVVVKGYNNRPFSLGIGSHSQNPNAKDVILPKGYVIQFDETAPNGNVWFKFKHPENGTQERGKSESGSMLNMIEDGVIKKK